MTRVVSLSYKQVIRLVPSLGLKVISMTTTRPDLCKDIYMPWSLCPTTPRGSRFQIFSIHHKTIVEVLNTGEQYVLPVREVCGLTHNDSAAEQLSSAGTGGRVVSVQRPPRNHRPSSAIYTEALKRSVSLFMNTQLP
ncbi:hypothetical protein ACOMHN_029659 [Nucella lapillus]